jgi:uncharacterized protein
MTIHVREAVSVSCVWQKPSRVKACLVLAHGAGAGMHHSFMEGLALRLAQRDMATLRYQFPYMEQGSKRPDLPQVCHATVRSAVAKAADLAPESPLFAGGKSFGGRMTSQAQAKAPLIGLRGIVFFGFPLHPAKKPSSDRARHLFDVDIPMLFLQGTRDELADLALLMPIAERLSQRATLVPIEDADHSFHVTRRSGRDDADVLDELAEATSAWMAALS